MKPYQQGAIDYFCGVYAVINAFRHAARGRAELSYTDGCAFYQYLITRLIKSDRFEEVLRHGTDAELLEKLLKKADGYVRREYGLKIDYSAPYADTDKDVLTAVEEIGKFLKQDGTAWLLRMNNKSLGDHWSVATTVCSDGKVALFDSYGAKSFDANKAVWTPPVKEKDRTPDNPSGMPIPPRGKTMLLKEGQFLIAVSSA